MRDHDRNGGMCNVRRHTTGMALAVVVTIAMLVILACPTVQAAQATSSSAFAFGHLEAEISATDLTTDYATNPLGIGAAHPDLAWKLTSTQRGQRQTSYQIQVWTASPAASGSSGTRGTLAWDSGRVSSANQIDILYAGAALHSSTRYFWRVRVWGATGHPSVWSAPAWWETGLLSSSDWSGAQWIGDPAPSTPPLSIIRPAPLLRKQFRTARQVARARVYVSGLGYYVLLIDGKRIGDRVLDPGFTSYNKTALYATYDVTSAVRQRGPHALGVILGRGFLGLPPADTKYWAVAPWLADPELLLKLEVDYTDGTHTTVVSNGSWQIHDGPTIRDSVYLGETYDAGLSQPGWDRPGFHSKRWQAASLRSAPTTNLQSESMPPIRVIDTLHAEQITTPRPGTYVFKFPVLTAGWARLQVSGPAGTEVTMRYGETLKSDGTVNNAGDPGLTNGPIQTDNYILSGHGIESWQPTFSYNGFQYIEVDGYPGVPTVENIVAKVVHTDLASTGTFTSSNDLLNIIDTETRRTLLNNMDSVLTDSPEFEKRPWLDDGTLLAATADDNFAMDPFFRNWVHDMIDSQGTDSASDDISPTAAPPGYSDPIWGGALVEVPWQIYQDYGDSTELGTEYNAMARYVDYLTAHSKGLIQKGFYGDWVSPAISGGSWPWPPEGAALTATAYFYRYATVLSQAARSLGHTADAARYTALAGQIKLAFNAKFLDPTTGVYHTDKKVGYRQTSNAVPLIFGLVPPQLVNKVTQNLVADVKARGNHLNTGDAGTKALLPALTEQGHADAAFAIATQRTYPSWGYHIGLGATTLWEGWLKNPRSRDHAFFGTIDDWFYRYLAGIQPTAPGYATITIKPYLPTGLNHVAASMDTVRGTVASSWTKAADGSLSLDVTVPVNVTAQVEVPAPGQWAVAEENQLASRSDGVRFERMDAGHAVFVVGSGTYHFHVTPKPGVQPLSP